MDISICLDHMLTALDREDSETAADHAADALEWFARGGFRPDNAGTSYVDMVARSLHTSADNWDADELGEESVSIVSLDRWDRMIFSAAMHADGMAEDCHAAYLVTRLDGRGFVWPELIGTADPAVSGQSKREAYERYEEIASGFYPPADDADDD